MGTKTCCSNNQTDRDSDLNFDKEANRKSITVLGTDEEQPQDFSEHPSAYMASQNRETRKPNPMKAKFRSSS